MSLKATLHSTEDKRFSCVACLGKYRDRKDGEEMTTKLRNTMRCFDQSPEPLHSISDSNGRVIRFKTCIGNFAQEHWFHWIELHAEYKRGLLPYPGTIQEQPNKVMEIFRVIDNHHNDLQMRRLKEQQDAERRKGSRGR